MKHRSPVHHSAQISLKQASRHDGVALSISKPDSRPESRAEKNRPFLEDFNMEHSCSNLTVKLKAFSVAVEAMDSSASRNPHASTNLPSCVYLG